MIVRGEVTAVGRALLAVRDLRKEYKDVVAVDDISLSVEEGEVFGLLGPNGAGKSTTISMVCGLLAPTRGQIFLDGKAVSGRGYEVKKVLGLVPQDIALYPTLTARENLRFFGKLHSLSGAALSERVDACLGYAGLLDRADQRIDTYSGGMKRRVNVAVGLIHKPRILILDEPTVGIDPQSRSHILETVLALNKEGITVIYTSHYMEEVEYLCSRLAIMDKGKVIAQGTKEELKAMIGDADRVVVGVDGAQEDLASALGQIPGVVGVDAGDDTLTMLVRDGHETVVPIIEAVVRSGAKVRSVHIEEPNLESVFLGLTGRALRD